MTELEARKQIYEAKWNLVLDKAHLDMFPKSYGWGQPGRQNLLPQPNRLAEFVAWAETQPQRETRCGYCRMPSTKSLCPTCGAPKA